MHINIYFIILSAPSSISCPDENLRISGGSFAFSKDGSIVRYSCSEGYYPTVRIRRTRYSHTHTHTKSFISEITCPDPRGFENGEKYPNQRQHFVNDTTHYSCHADFRGSGTRVCQANMKWSGGTTETVTDLCPDPGIPAGCTRTGHMFNIKPPGRRSNMAAHCSGCVFMVCVCSLLCNLTHTHIFYTSLNVMCHIPNENLTYVHYRQISYYQVSPNYEILNFCHRRYMDSLQEGLQEAKKMTRKGDRSETNIVQANERILESMKIEQMENKKEFQQTQHIIIKLTDGQANMGAHLHLTFFCCCTELYVFVMGDDMNAEDMNDLKTDRGNKNVALCGVYTYRDHDNGTESHKCHQYPWLAKISVTVVLSLMFCNNGKISNCVGSLVTSSFILTAAHCFRFEDTPDRITVDMGSDIKGIKLKDYIPHPRYDLNLNLNLNLKMGIPEYYEFDVTLIQLKEPVIMGIVFLIAITRSGFVLTDKEGACVRRTVRDIRTDTKKAEGITAKNANYIVTDNFPSKLIMLCISSTVFFNHFSCLPIPFNSTLSYFKSYASFFRTPLTFL
uniref:Complement factor b, like n=1 Tax=Sinocyclocheilus rhinocerous TaxID=307959 RepID=A0A673IK82_9TELE